MQKNDKNLDEDIISISDIVIILIKRIKIFFVILVLGIIASVIAFYLKQDKYEYNANQGLNFNQNSCQNMC